MYPLAVCSRRTRNLLLHSCLCCVPLYIAMSPCNGSSCRCIMLRCIYFAPIIQRVHGDGGEGKEKESEVTDIRDDSLCKVRKMRLNIIWRKK